MFGNHSLCIYGKCTENFIKERQKETTSYWMPGGICIPGNSAAERAVDHRDGIQFQRFQGEHRDLNNRWLQRMGKVDWQVAQNTFPAEAPTGTVANTYQNVLHTTVIRLWSATLRNLTTVLR